MRKVSGKLKGEIKVRDEDIGKSFRLLIYDDDENPDTEDKVYVENMIRQLNQLKDQRAYLDHQIKHLNLQLEKIKSV
jgi:hypothetical protein